MKITVEKKKCVLAISSIEYNSDLNFYLIIAKHYPIYGIQFHPEKIGFEWIPDEVIPHSEHAVIIMQSLANFFVEEGEYIYI